MECLIQRLTDLTENSSDFDFIAIPCAKVINIAIGDSCIDERILDVAVQDIMREIERPLTPLDEPQVWQELLILLQQCLQAQDSEQERSSPNA